MDVHSIYADDYVQKCVDTLNITGADNVGGSIRPRGFGYLQEAIAIASHSSFSMGGARFHDEDYEGPVDTVYLGCWRKNTLEDLGMFDEEMVRTEDDELNLRITKRGGKIWQSKEIRSWYYPRSSLRSLFSQLYQYGYWKVGVIQKHKRPTSLRSLVPSLFLGALLILLALSVINHVFAWGFLILVGIYAVATLIASIVACQKSSLVRYLPIMPIIFFAFHFGYGFGFLRGIIDFGLRGSKGHISFSNPKRG
jgi:GT2 family glycosyltransferase